MRRMFAIPRPRFRLRSLIAVVALAGILFCSVALHLKSLRNENRALARLKSYGCEIHYSPRRPKWLWRLAGEEYQLQPETLMFDGASLDAQQIADIRLVRGLHALYLANSQVSGDLQWIRNFDDLIVLSLDRCSTTGSVIDVRGLADLQELTVRFTAVETLLVDGCAALETIDLRGAPVTDAMVATIARSELPRLKTLDIASAAGTRNQEVTDATLKSLEGVATLRQLYIYATKATKEGIAGLKSVNPNLIIAN